MVKGFWRGESRVMEKREGVFKLSTFFLFEFAGKKLSKNNLFKWFLCVMFNDKYQGIKILEIECQSVK